jgi:Flp pilus assembly protein TadD/TolB-like protein
MIGEAVSHYEILDKLGEGGMGVVYLARDLRLQRLVALKFLPVEITATAASIARFELEARAISALNHPHIATIHAMEESGGRRYLVLEYLPGGTLRKRIDEVRALNQQFPLHEAVRIAIETAQGLAHAHRHGIVHRDIKPENVMFTAESLLRITDFGLAKSAASELTRDGTTVGTAAYMAPEQATRNETSPRSDLFSLGVMLHEMIAGQRPFTGASEFATMQAVVSAEPAPLNATRSDVPGRLQRIVARLLEKNPSQRYQTGEEVAAELSSLDLLVSTTEMTAIDLAGVTRTMAAATVPSSRPRRRLWIYPAIGILIVVLSVALVWKLRHTMARTTRATQLAILPFTAKSGASEDVAFGNGLAGIISGKLAALGPDVWIIPANDLRQNRVTTPLEARKVFGVAIVLTGEVDRQPSGARNVEIHLVETATRKILRSASVRPSDAASPLEEEVMKQAADMLGISLDPLAVSKLRADQTHTANAYDYYVLGNGYLQRYDQAGNTGSAIAAFQKAIQLDPSYAMAYAGLGSAYLRQYRSTSDPQYLERARDAANQALSRNENMDVPHIILGTIAMLTGQTEEGIRQLRIALDRDPVNSEAYRELAKAYVQAHKLSDAKATYDRAIQLRPGFWLGYLDSATFYNNNGQYAEAEARLKTALNLTPDNYLVYRNLGAVRMARGEWEAAEHDVKQAIDLRPGGSVYTNMGVLYIYEGRFADAVRILEQAVSQGGGDEKHAYLAWGNLGDAYRFSPGRESSAREAYKKAIDLATVQLAANTADPTLISQIALYRAKQGELEAAQSGMKDALKLESKDPNILFTSAVVLELAGKRAPSLTALRSAVQAGYSLSFIERDPELISLRKDPHYAEIATYAKGQQ